MQLEASLLRQTAAERDREGQTEAAGEDRGAKRARASPGQETERGREDSDSDFEVVEAPASSKRRRASGSSVSTSREGQRGAAPGGRRSSRLSARSPAVASAASPASDPEIDGERQRDTVVDLSQDSYADGASAVTQRETEKRGSGGDGRVACPICSMSVSVRNINAHMDTCLSKTTAASEKDRDGPSDRCAERPAPAGPTGGEVAAAAAAPGPVARMPKLTYHVRPDKHFHLSQSVPRTKMISRCGAGAERTSTAEALQRARPLHTRRSQSVRVAPPAVCTGAQHRL